MPELSALSVADIAECTRVVHELGLRSGSMEECAAGVVRHLYESLASKEAGGPACALVRFFKTHDWSRLEPELREAAREALGGTVATPGMKCLTLLATAGQEEAWNSRRRSVAHRAIPLPSPRVVERMPMVSQLVRQLGYDVAELLEADPELIVGLEERGTNVFYIGDAQGSPYIPAQAEFVEPYGVRSVVGFGGVLPSGDLFAIILFSKVRLPREKAELFRILAVSVKAAVLRFDWGPTFAAAPPAPASPRGAGEARRDASERSRGSGGDGA